MKIDYDKLLTTAERVHIRILQVLNVLLTIALWLLVLGGGYVSYSWFHSGFRISNVSIDGLAKGIIRLFKEADLKMFRRHSYEKARNYLETEIEKRWKEVLS